MPRRAKVWEETSRLVGRRVKEISSEKGILVEADFVGGAWA